MFILGTATIVSQNVFDALRYSNDQIEGSARFSAMSGAFGALGGELSAISINPAGSAIFSKGVASFTLSNYKTCLLYTSPSPRDGLLSRMPSSA